MLVGMTAEEIEAMELQLGADDPKVKMMKELESGQWPIASTAVEMFNSQVSPMLGMFPAL